MSKPKIESDAKGFVFLDALNRPYRCALIGAQQWLMYWNHGLKCWVTLRPVTQSEVESFPHNLTQKEQDCYYPKGEK